MSGLSAFLAGNVVKRENKKVVISERFVEDGKPIAWEIRPISAYEDEAIRKQCMKQVPIVGKRNQYRPEFDANAYLAMVTAKSVIFPDLNNAELQNSYGVMGAEDLLRAMLYKDEFDVLTEAVMGVTETEDVDDLVDEAKN